MAKQKRYNGYLRRTFSYNDKRYYVYGKTREELSENENKKRQELITGEINRHNPTLLAYYEYFTELRRKEVRESTIRGQKSQFKTLSSVILDNSRTFGEIRLKDITRRDIESVRQILLDNGKTAENINIIIAHLNHVLHCAVLDDTIDKNPCKAIKQLKRIERPARETKHRALTQQETTDFFKVAESRNSYYINAMRFMALTGMRIGEIGALYLTDIDRKNGFIHVRRTVMRNETGGYTIGENAKTKSGQRDIPLTDDIIACIRQQEQLNRVIHGFDKTGLLFRSAENDILKEYAVNREIKRICTAAGIEKFTCHALRATFATRFIEQRPQDYKILSEILGHNDVGITLNLYTHVMAENKIKAMQEVSIKTEMIS